MSITRVTPMIHADDAMASAEWYRALGFEVTNVYQPPGDPCFVTLKAGDEWLFLSEHAGDATPDTLVYLHVDDVDAVAERIGVAAEDRPWGMREIHLTDPAGNRVRVGAGIA